MKFHFGHGMVSGETPGRGSPPAPTETPRPNLSRRSFLALLAAGAVAATVDVDKLLWEPGQKTIFLPSPQTIVPVTLDEMFNVDFDFTTARPNSLLTIDMVTREALKILEQNLTFTRRINRTYDDKFVIASARHHVHPMVPARAGAHVHGTCFVLPDPLPPNYIHAIDCDLDEDCTCRT